MLLGCAGAGEEGSVSVLLLLPGVGFLPFIYLIGSPAHLIQALLTSFHNLSFFLKCLSALHCPHPPTTVQEGVSRRRRRDRPGVLLPPWKGELQG